MGGSSLETGTTRTPSKSSFAPGIPPKRGAAADRVIPVVIERLDFAVAERWLAALAEARPTWSPGLTTGELMLAMAREDFGQGVQIADRLASLGERGELARASSRAAALMAWFYLSAGRVQEAQAVLDVARPSSEVDALYYALTHSGVPEADVMVPLTGGPLDALVMRVHYPQAAVAPRRGTRLPVGRKVAEPWRIGPGSARTDRAGACAVRERDRGRRRQSRAARPVRPRAAGGGGARRRPGTSFGVAGADPSERLAQPNGSALSWRPRSSCVSATILKRPSRPCTRRDPPRAVDFSSSSSRSTRCPASPCCSKATFRGARPATTGRQHGCRRPDPPPRDGSRLPGRGAPASRRHRRRNRAADLALASATKQGSNHLLLQALADFPSLVSHRLQAGVESDSPWRELARTLGSRGARLDRAG